MFNNLALIAGANYISTVHSLHQNQNRDKSLVQTDATYKNEQQFETLDPTDPNYYAMVDAFSQYKSDIQMPRFR